MSFNSTSISAVTRRDILDLISAERIAWSGRLSEVAFLSRLYDLSALPSTDSRFDDAAGDIHQHRVNNFDWDDDWVFDDSRFNLRHGSDEAFLAFLAAMLHPVVRADEQGTVDLCERFNEMLRRDGRRLVQVGRLSGRPVFAGAASHGHAHAASALPLERYERLGDPEAVREHLRRIDAGLESDPAAAVGSSKELIETVCKMVLNDYGIEYARRDEAMTLLKKTTKVLALRPEDIPEGKRGSDAAQQIVRALVPMVQGLTELRNELGLGHGRATHSNVPIRYARLAFNSTVAVVEFLLETWHVRRQVPTPGASVREAG